MRTPISSIAVLALLSGACQNSSPAPTSPLLANFLVTFDS